MQKISFSLVLALAFLALPLYAQNDTLHNRNVVVEREFQPVVQSAGKINQQPVQTELQLPVNEVEYSDYNALLSPSFNTNDLLSQPQRFSTPHPLHGYIRAGLGHTNTLLDFEYSLHGIPGGKQSSKDLLRIYANHRAQWGLRANSNTVLGLRYAHSFSNMQMYFGLDGRNRYFHRYGRYYDPSTANLAIERASELRNEDKQTIWGANVFVGVKSKARNPFQYDVQVGYHLMSLPEYASEHQVRTKANLGYRMQRHAFGANLSAIDAFVSTDSIPDSLYTSRHAIRIEPYYAYKGSRFTLHVGVNLDLNVGRGQLLSNNENISFAPSPNVQFEGQIAKEWLTLYGDFKGSLGTGNFQAHMDGFPYRDVARGILSRHVAGYIPVDGTIGFHIKPYRDLLISIYGGYAYQKNQTTLIATAKEFPDSYLPGTFVYTYSDYGRGKIGADFHYHLQDIVKVHLRGNYYFWQSFGHESIPVVAYRPYFVDPNTAEPTMPTDEIYDRANWDISLRIDGRIDEHWSLYSDNFISGKRHALVAGLGSTYQKYELKPMVELNLGCQYEQAQWTAFFQLNNFIHRHNDIYYGYQSEGINFLLGGSYRF